MFVLQASKVRESIPQHKDCGKALKIVGNTLARVSSSNRLLDAASICDSGMRCNDDKSPSGQTLRNNETALPFKRPSWRSSVYGGDDLFVCI